MSSTDLADSDASAWRIARDAWGAVRDTVGTMPAAFLAVTGIIGVVLLLQYFSSGWWASDNPFSLSYVLKARAISLVFDCVQSAALSLVAVPVYQMVVRDEATEVGALLSERTLRIAAWLVVYRILTFVFVLPTALARVIAVEYGLSMTTVGLNIAAYGLVAQLGLLYVWVRLGLLYPAVALDEPTVEGSRLGDAWRLSSRRQWRIIWSAVLAFLPVYGVAVVFGAIAFLSRANLGPSGNGISWGTIIISTVVAVVSAALGAAILGWNYRLITGRHHELTAETFA